MDKIRSASVEELSAVKGMNMSAAESIKAHLE
jgi:excinuclease UvrABC nuclease subunit